MKIGRIWLIFILDMVLLNLLIDNKEHFGGQLWIGFWGGLGSLFNALSVFAVTKKSVSKETHVSVGEKLNA